MDLPITLITPDVHEARGAKAYDEGLGADDHGMNPGSPAIKDWQYGWHQRRIEHSSARGNQAVQQLAEACPP